MKLNGWHRLWILLSIIYFVLVISYVIIKFPKAENIQHAGEFYKKLSKKSAEMIISTTYEDTIGLGGKDVTGEFYHSTNLSREFILVPGPERGINEKMPNGHTIVFRYNCSEEDIRIASQEYWKAVEQKASEKRRHLLLYAFLFWIVPCMGLYALVWSINWVYKGFISKKDTQQNIQADRD